MSKNTTYKKCPKCKQDVQSYFTGEANEGTKFNWRVECLQCGHEGLGTEFYVEPPDDDQARSMVGTGSVMHPELSDDITAQVLKDMPLQDGGTVQIKEGADVAGFDMGFVYTGILKLYGPELCQVEFFDETKAGVYMIPTEALEHLRPASPEFNMSGINESPRIEKIRTLLLEHEILIATEGITTGQLIHHGGRLYEGICVVAFGDGVS